MPTGYCAEGKVYNKRLGKWEKKRKEQVFDYTSLDMRSAGLLISFFRFYPDYLMDIARSPHARYGLELIQRVILRIFARYRIAYITGCRGLTKTYLINGFQVVDGKLYPGIHTRYCAPNQKQSAVLASQAFKALEEDYPLLILGWGRNADRADMFKVSTVLGSEFTMYAPRGDNSTAVIAEEAAQEGEDGFDHNKFQKDILPTCRIVRKVNGRDDRTRINCKKHYISNAGTRQNPAYTKYRMGALTEMMSGEKYEGFVADIPWQVALLSNIRTIEYFKDQKKELSAEDWLREACAIYTGTGESPMLRDEVLSRAKRLQVAELEHCGDNDCIYIVSHDVSYVDNAKNAKCADVVLKLTQYTDTWHRDKYRKQVVFIDNYPPPNTDVLQAQKLKELWIRFCQNGAQTTYLCIDTQAYGTGVVEELMKPADDGTPTLCCLEGFAPFADDFSRIKQPGALPVIYPMKAGGHAGNCDPDSEMISYAQLEFEKGYVELLNTNVFDGINAYKKFHNIKDDKSDFMIQQPYKQTELLCQQIGNLKTKVTGLTKKEERRSIAIQRDIWSALKYALRVAQRCESMLVTENYKAKSSWQEKIKNSAGSTRNGGKQPQNNLRANLLSQRHK